MKLTNNVPLILKVQGISKEREREGEREREPGRERERERERENKSAGNYISIYISIPPGPE
jgi:hypothetical protein